MTIPSLARGDIELAAEVLAPLVRETPAWAWRDELTERLLAPGTQPILKLELFQHAGSFKARGALNVMLGLDESALARGVTAVSAGNHAIAVAWAARTLGRTAKVVMPKVADPFRVSRCSRARRGGGPGG
jgi:threonine dehydratase